MKVGIATQILRKSMEFAMRIKATIYGVSALAGFSLLVSGQASAQSLDPASDSTRFILDSLMMGLSGFAAIIFIFAYGLRDAGLARAHNVLSVGLRTVGLIATAAVVYWLSGYTLSHSVESNGMLGEFGSWLPSDDDPITAGRSDGAYWFFQMALTAIPATIVASAVSERAKLWAFLFAAAAMCGVTTPIISSWVWHGGYLATSWRMFDATGAGVIHLAGGAAALAAAIIVGPRPGKYLDGIVRPSPATALALAAIATGFLWISWIVIMVGRNGSIANVEAAIQFGELLINVAMAVSGAVLASLFLTQLVYKRAGLITALNATIASLVSLSADPLSPAIWQAMMIGAVGGVIVTVAPPFFDRYRIDDAGFVVPAHCFCGVWGLVIVSWTNPDVGIVGQLVGAIAIGGFSFFLSLLVWTALKYSIGVRQRSKEDLEASQSPV